MYLSPGTCLLWKFKLFVPLDLFSLLLLLELLGSFKWKFNSFFLVHSSFFSSFFFGELDNLVEFNKWGILQFYSMPGGCKYGGSCRYAHYLGKSDVGSVELNFLGLPIRPVSMRFSFTSWSSFYGSGHYCRGRFVSQSMWNQLIALNSKRSLSG